jgi:hypothetical protein
VKRSALSLLDSASVDNSRETSREHNPPGFDESHAESGTRWRVIRPLRAEDRDSNPPPSGARQAESGEPIYERAKRKRLVKARTLSTSRLQDREPQGYGLPSGGPEDALLGFDAEPGTGPRPTTRAECASGPRPCPYVSCRYHLYLEVSPRTGSLKLNFPDLEVWELTESCSLDVAERGAQSTEHLGALLNLTPERARQLEQNALRAVATTLDGG